MATAAVAPGIVSFLTAHRAYKAVQQTGRLPEVQQAAEPSYQAWVHSDAPLTAAVTPYDLRKLMTVGSLSGEAAGPLASPPGKGPQTSRQASTSSSPVKKQQDAASAGAAGSTSNKASTPAAAGSSSSTAVVSSVQVAAGKGGGAGAAAAAARAFELDLDPEARQHLHTMQAELAKLQQQGSSGSISSDDLKPAMAALELCVSRAVETTRHQVSAEHGLPDDALQNEAGQLQLVVDALLDSFVNEVQKDDTSSSGELPKFALLEIVKVMRTTVASSLQGQPATTASSSSSKSSRKSSTQGQDGSGTRASDAAGSPGRSADSGAGASEAQQPPSAQAEQQQQQPEGNTGSPGEHDAAAAGSAINRAPASPAAAADADGNDSGAQQQQQQQQQQSVAKEGAAGQHDAAAAGSAVNHPPDDAGATAAAAAAAAAAADANDGVSQTQQQQQQQQQQQPEPPLEGSVSHAMDPHSDSEQEGSCSEGEEEDPLAGIRVMPASHEDLLHLNVKAAAAAAFYVLEYASYIIPGFQYRLAEESEGFGDKSFAVLPVHRAVAVGHVEVLQRLLVGGADTDHCCSNGYSPMLQVRLSGRGFVDSSWLQVGVVAALRWYGSRLYPESWCEWHVVGAVGRAGASSANCPRCQPALCCCF